MKWSIHVPLSQQHPGVPAASTPPLSHLTCPRRTTKNIQNFLKMKNITKHSESDIILEGPNDTFTLRVNTDAGWKVKMTSENWQTSRAK